MDWSALDLLTRSVLAQHSAEWWLCMEYTHLLPQPAQIAAQNFWIPKMDCQILMFALAASLLAALWWKLGKSWQARRRKELGGYKALPLVSDEEEAHVESHEGPYISYPVDSDGESPEVDRAEDSLLKTPCTADSEAQQSEPDVSLGICSTLFFGLGTLTWLVALLLCKTTTWLMLLMTMPGYFYGAFVALYAEWSHDPVDLIIGIVSAALFVWCLALPFLEGKPWYVLALQGASALLGTLALRSRFWFTELEPIKRFRLSLSSLLVAWLAVDLMPVSAT
ncbi:unnamed protein product [Durusdinium trenchii]|uniref:Phosphatidic acid phosphatase type 2/haloperoxidase domain-containing protein n=1 Tax=Durusdinium trenchii TaxID=1381693 RepID=A0ABP0MWD1_9DINO